MRSAPLVFASPGQSGECRQPQDLNLQGGAVRKARRGTAERASTMPVVNSPLREVQPNPAAPQPAPEAPIKPGLSVDSLPIGAPTPNPFDDRPVGKGPSAARKKRAPAAEAAAAPPLNIEEMPVGGGSAQPMAGARPSGRRPAAARSRTPAAHPRPPPAARRAQSTRRATRRPRTTRARSRAYRSTSASPPSAGRSASPATTS